MAVSRGAGQAFRAAGARRTGAGGRNQGWVWPVEPRSLGGQSSASLCTGAEEKLTPPTIPAAQSQTQLPWKVVSTTSQEVSKYQNASVPGWQAQDVWAGALVSLSCVCEGGCQRAGPSRHGPEVSARSWGTIVPGSLLGLRPSQGLGTKWVQ